MALPKKKFQCGSCGEIIEVPKGIPKPVKCPKCGAAAYMIHRLEPGPPEKEEEEVGRGGNVRRLNLSFNFKSQSAIWS
jgi:predicted RNA-binding Zn-ribbon protein involved in translation (DUF1610 family)